MQSLRMPDVEDVPGRPGAVVHGTPTNEDVAGVGALVRDAISTVGETEQRICDQ
jgi:hypothetical protein